MDEKTISELTICTLKLIDQAISPEEIEKLNDLIASDPQAARYYNQLTMAVSDFKDHGKEIILDDAAVGSVLQEEFWKTMADYEKTAPTIEIPKIKPDLVRAGTKTVNPSRQKRKLGWFEILTLANAAAVILFFVFIRFAPPKTGIEVATVIDSIDAQWGDTSRDFQTGSRLITSRDEFSLREGIVKILFDDSAKVLIEAPAAFEVISENHVKLHYGRIYSTVPTEAIGFTVSTLSADIVDLGTEFGVEVDYSGDTVLHVIKGKTSLSAGNKTSQSGILVNAGNAKKVSEDTYAVTDVPCDDRRFVRDIDSDKKLVWRGEPAKVSGSNGIAVQVEPAQWNGYIDWVSDSGSWGDGSNWNAGVKPDSTWSIKLRNKSSVCTLNTRETPISNNLEVYDGQTLNIETGGYMGCGWSRFGWSNVNMTGNGTWVLNDENLVIGYDNRKDGPCIWTMSDESKIDSVRNSISRDILCVSENDGVGTLKIIGSDVTVNCAQFYMGRTFKSIYSPTSTLEFVMDAAGASTIHVKYSIFLSDGQATSHLKLSASEPLLPKDIVLIENTGTKGMIGGDGAFDTMNRGPALEGTDITIGQNTYKLTYKYAAGKDGIENDIALVFQNKSE